MGGQLVVQLVEGDGRIRLDLAAELLTPEIVSLLTHLLLYRAGFIVGKYISIEMLIEKSKDSYYEALQESSQNWHENGNDYLPFLKYILGVVVKAYNEFEDRVEHLRHRRMSKADRIRAIIDKIVSGYLTN